MLDDAACEVCSMEDEDATHILFGCPFAKVFWEAIGAVLPDDVSAPNLRGITCPRLPADHSDAFVLLCCWQLWKRRNGVV